MQVVRGVLRVGVVSVSSGWAARKASQSMPEVTLDRPFCRIHANAASLSFDTPLSREPA